MVDPSTTKIWCKLLFNLKMLSLASLQMSLSSLHHPFFHNTKKILEKLDIYFVVRVLYYYFFKKNNNNKRKKINAFCLSGEWEQIGCVSFGVVSHLVVACLVIKLSESCVWFWQWRIDGDLFFSMLWIWVVGSLCTASWSTLFSFSSFLFVVCFQTSTFPTLKIYFLSP